MINIVLTKEDFNILLGCKELEEYRFNDNLWLDYTYSDEQYQYIVDLYVVDWVVEKIMWYIQEKEGNIFNHIIYKLRQQIQNKIDERKELKIWMKGNRDEIIPTTLKNKLDEKYKLKTKALNEKRDRKYIDNFYMK
jgi:hypothetical protein